MCHSRTAALQCALSRNLSLRRLNPTTRPRVPRGQTHSPPPASDSATSPGISAAAEIQRPLQPPGIMVKLVYTASDLQLATGVGGAVDIEIRSHLDFRGLQTGPSTERGDFTGTSGFQAFDDHLENYALDFFDPVGEHSRFLVAGLPPTRSIRVRCALHAVLGGIMTCWINNCTNYPRKV